MVCSEFLPPSWHQIEFVPRWQHSNAVALCGCISSMFYWFQHMHFLCCKGICIWSCDSRICTLGLCSLPSNPDPLVKLPRGWWCRHLQGDPGPSAAWCPCRGSIEFTGWVCTRGLLIHTNTYLLHTSASCKSIVCFRLYFVWCTLLCNVLLKKNLIQVMYCYWCISILSCVCFRDVSK